MPDPKTQFDVFKKSVNLPVGYLEMLSRVQPDSTFKPQINPKPRDWQKFDKLVNSSYSDSLQTISGPVNFDMIPNQKDIGGAYIGNENLVVMSPRGIQQEQNDFPFLAMADRITPRWTLAHEMSHKYGTQNTKQTKELYKTLGAIYDLRMKELKGKVPEGYPDIGYWTTNKEEMFADALASAWDYLQRSNSPKEKLDIKKVVEDFQTREEEYPGTTAAVSHLLMQPLFSKHPLRKIFDEKKKDVDTSKLNKDTWTKLFGQTPAQPNGKLP